MKQFFAEIKPILLLLAAIIITCVLVPLGILYNFGKAIYQAIKLRPIKALGSFFTYWLGIIYQLWNVIKYFLVRIAVCLDLIWNATAGEIIEDCVTAKEDTLYGNGNITISAATGELEAEGKLNKTGIGFKNLLTRALGKDHCKNAWEKEKDYPINE